MVISRVIALVLRIVQLISALIVVGIIGHYLRIQDDNGWWPGSRFIYTEVIAALSLLASLLLLIPFTYALTLFPLDFTMFILWIVSFGLLADHIAPLNCTWAPTWAPRYYAYGSDVDNCSTWKTALAFIFISAIAWLCSAILALWVISRTRRSALASRRWYRAHEV